LATDAADLLHAISAGNWVKAAEEITKLKADIAKAEADCKNKG